MGYASKTGRSRGVSLKIRMSMPPAGLAGDQGPEAPGVGVFCCDKDWFGESASS